jgi:hypothetical protein
MRVFRILTWCLLWPCFVLAFIVVGIVLEGIAVGALEGHERWRMGFVDLLRRKP